MVRDGAIVTIEVTVGVIVAPVGDAVPVENTVGVIVSHADGDFPFPLRFLLDFDIFPILDDVWQSSSFGDLLDIPFIFIPLCDGEGQKGIVGSMVRSGEPFPLPIILFLDRISIKCVEDVVVHVSLRYSLVKISSLENILFC